MYIAIVSFAANPLGRELAWDFAHTQWPTLKTATNAAPQTVQVDAGPFAADVAGLGVNVSAWELANFTMRLLSAAVAGVAVAPGSLALRQVGTGAAFIFPSRSRGPTTRASRSRRCADKATCSLRRSPHSPPTRSASA